MIQKNTDIQVQKYKNTTTINEQKCCENKLPVGLHRNICIQYAIYKNPVNKVNTVMQEIY